MTADESDQREPHSLGGLLGELSDRPVGDRRLDRWRARAVASPSGRRRRAG